MPVQRFSAIVFVILVGSALGQVVGPGTVSYVTSAPSGNCSAGSPMQIVYGLGSVYTCQNGTWTQVGGTGAAYLGSNATLASNYGVVAQGIIVNNATTVSGSSTITIPASDPAFTGVNAQRSCGQNACVGDLIQAVSGDGISSGSIACPQSTILTVNSATSVTVASASDCTANLNGNATLAWGPDESTVLDNAYAATLVNCTPLLLPAGNILVQQPEMNYTGTACGNSSATYKTPNIVGAAPASTYIIPMQGFNPAAGHTCGNASPPVNSCFFGVQFQIVTGVKIWGMGIKPTASMTNKVLVSNQFGIMDYVVGLGWCPVNSCIGSLGFSIVGNQAENQNGGSIGFGQAGTYMNGFLAQILQWPSYAANVGLQVHSGSAKSQGNFFGGGIAILVEAGAKLSSEFDSDDQAVTGGPISISGTAVFSNFVSTQTGAGSLTIATTGKVYSSNSTWPQDTGTHFVTFTGTAGQFIDQGGNTITGTATGTGVVIGSGSADSTPQVTGNIALTSGWDTSTVTACGTQGCGFTRKEKFTITGAGSPSASPVVTVTFPANFLATPACQLQQTAGTFGELTNPSLPSPSISGVAITFAGTPVAGHSYTFALSCDL